MEIVKQHRDAGYEALGAGGCVRNRLLSLEPKDYGVATSARPDGQEVSLALEILRRQAKSTSGAPLGLGGIDIRWAASYSQLESLGGHRNALAAAAGWYGRVAEWSNAPVLKTGVPQGTGGSNPSPTAWQMFNSCPSLPACCARAGAKVSRRSF